MKQTIIRNGKEITRNMKIVNYDSNINIRVSSETIEELKQIANSLGVKYNTMVREILEDYVEECKNVNPKRNKDISDRTNPK